MQKWRKRIAFLIGIAMVVCCSFSAAALPANHENLYYGIDISDNQGTVDFQEVAQSGISIVYIKAGQGDEVEPRFDTTVEQAKQANLKIGFYFYVTATTQAQARMQASFFARLIRDIDFDCRPAMDFESFDDLTHSEINGIATAFLQTLKTLTGVVPMVYSDAYDARTLWNKSVAGYPLWVAEYGSSSPDAGDLWTGWTGWQYSDRGAVSGIDTDVDLDYFTQGVFFSKPSIPDQPDVIHYTVQTGDTLWAIARRYGVGLNKLIQYNHLTHPNLIYTGDILLIPLRDVTFQRNDVILYQIQAGDTLWAIARRFHSSLAQIVSINQIKNPDLIYAGDVLRIPLSNS